MDETQKIYQKFLTDDGSWTIKNTLIDECYHSKFGAASEAQQLYINSSRITDRLTMSSIELSVLDVGLGLGYNALATIESWHKSPSQCDLYLTSLENDPILLDALASGQAEWQGSLPKDHLKWISALCKTSTGYQAEIQHPTTGKKLMWNILLGDALLLEKNKIQPKVSFIWQDPFSPTKNPSMWSSEWFAMLKEISHPDVVLLTYSVARSVKNALLDANWKFQKISGNTTKRHWLKASV